jgi:molybdopterin-guanine dinucleotide biosynthesis protein B
MRILGLARWSGSGKTTLLVKLIPRLVARGLKVSTLKHAHHGFDVDQPGKDSHSHRTAGASEVLIASARRWALMHELRDQPEPSLYQLLQKLAPVDLVVVEGFKTALHAKIEVYRREVGKPPFHPENPSVAGIASDTPFPRAGRPVVDLADVDAVVDLMVACAEPIDVVLARAGLAASRERSLPAVT